MRFGAVVLLVSVLVAGGAGLAQQAPEPAQTHCYAGTSQVTLPDGSGAGTSQVWVRRTLDPASSRITEHVVLLPAGAPAPETHDLVLQVTGNTFSGSAEGMSVTGELTGEPWAWASWHSESTLPDGVRVTSDDTLTDTGLHNVQRVVDTAGSPVVTLDGTVTEMPCSDWDQSVPPATPAPTP